MQFTPGQTTNHSLYSLGDIRLYDPNARVTLVRGRGVVVWDESGRDYFDFTSSYSANNFGHAHQQLTAVARKQLDSLCLATGFGSQAKDHLTRTLISWAPWSEPSKVWLNTTGARAIETAWKIAYACRPGIILPFDLAFHGRSLATALISSTGRLPIIPSSIDSPLPFPSWPEGSEAHHSLKEQRCLENIESRIRSEAERISAIIVEPVLGAKGYFFASPQFFARLRELTAEFGIILISDEIQMGLGRMGARFASQSMGWVPDLIVLGKSLGGGIVPISAVLGPARLMDQLPVGIESETFAGNPLACRIGLEVTKLCDSPDTFELAIAIGKKLRQWLADWLREAKTQSRWEVGTSVEARGCCAVLQVGSSGKNSSCQTAYQLVSSARDAGVLIQLTGPQRDRIVMAPPITTSMKQIDQALGRLELAWASVCT